jgi:hypothetical protein
VLLLDELVLELLLLYDHQLADLIDLLLLLKLCNSQLHCHRVLQRVDLILSTLSQRLLQHNSSSATPQKNVVRNNTIRKLTINATLRVTMVFTRPAYLHCRRRCPVAKECHSCQPLVAATSGSTKESQLLVS